MTDYKLINPHIKGKLTSYVTSDNPLLAAKKIWEQISEHIAGDVPQFAFTLQDVKAKKNYSFFVKENRDESDEVNFDITPLKISKDNEVKLEKNVQKFEKEISNKKSLSRSDKRYNLTDDDDDDDDDEEDYKDEKKKLRKLYKKAKLQNYINNAQAIYYWWYYPSVYDLSSFYVPTFVYPITPYVQIDLGTAIFP